MQHKPRRAKSKSIAAPVPVVLSSCGGAVAVRRGRVPSKSSSRGSSSNDIHGNNFGSMYEGGDNEDVYHQEKDSSGSSSASSSAAATSAPTSAPVSVRVQELVAAARARAEQEAKNFPFPLKSCLLRRKRSVSFAVHLADYKESECTFEEIVAYHNTSIHPPPLPPAPAPASAAVASLLLSNSVLTNDIAAWNATPATPSEYKVAVPVDRNVAYLALRRADQLKYELVFDLAEDYLTEPVSKESSAALTSTRLNLKLLYPAGALKDTTYSRATAEDAAVYEVALKLESRAAELIAVFKMIQQPIYGFRGKIMKVRFCKCFATVVSVIAHFYCV
jgi:hypothetical protein